MTQIFRKWMNFWGGGGGADFSQMQILYAYTFYRGQAGNFTQYYNRL